jgi:hypothetical protein
VTRIRITTPVEDHNGAVGKVFITQGVGFADTEVHAAEIAYCRANGYTITELEPEPEAEADDDSDGDKLPRRNASAEAWRAYAVAHGMSADEAEESTRDQLVERFTSTEETDQ